MRTSAYQISLRRPPREGCPVESVPSDRGAFATIPLWQGSSFDYRQNLLSVAMELGSFSLCERDDAFRLTAASVLELDIASTVKSAGFASSHWDSSRTTDLLLFHIFHQLSSRASAGLISAWMERRGPWSAAPSSLQGVPTHNGRQDQSAATETHGSITSQLSRPSIPQTWPAS